MNDQSEVDTVIQRKAGFWILPYSGYVDIYLNHMPYMAIARKPNEGRGTWTIRGIDSIVVCCTDGWYIVSNSPTDREIGHVEARFDTVEEAVTYCNLMDNT